MRILGTAVIVVIALIFGGIVGFVVGAGLGGAAGWNASGAVGEQYAANQYWAGSKVAIDHVTDGSDAEIIKERGHVYLKVPNNSTEGGYSSIYLANNSSWNEPPYNLNKTMNETVNRSINQTFNQILNGTVNGSTNSSQ